MPDIRQSGGLEYKTQSLDHQIWLRTLICSYRAAKSGCGTLARLRLTTATSGRCCRYLAELFVEGLCRDSKKCVATMQTVCPL